MIFSTYSLCGVDKLLLEIKFLNEIFCCVLDFASVGLGRKSATGQGCWVMACQTQAFSAFLSVPDFSSDQHMTATQQKCTKVLNEIHIYWAPSGCQFLL